MPTASLDPANEFSHLDPANPLYVLIEHTDVAQGVILKIHALCNLACTYCYMYNDGAPWRPRSKKMSEKVIRQTARRIREYMDEHRLSGLNIILHGGEPLLAGIDTIRSIVETFRSAAGPDCTLHFSIQTNGTLLSDEAANADEIADTLAELGIKAGVSLDGDKDGNSLRLYRDGRSSYQQTIQGIRRLKSRGILEGLLAVINLEHDPKETAKALLEFDVPVDCLLPIGTWDVEPAIKPAFASTPTPYGEWLLDFYVHWFKLGGQVDNLRIIRKIVQFIDAHLRKQPVPAELRVEWLGPWRVGDLVIETDGKLEMSDGLNMIHNGDSATGRDVFRHRLTHGLIALLEASEANKLVSGPTLCQPCKLRDICGGGHHLHRHGARHGYDNPSIYCADLQLVILSLAKAYWDNLQLPENREEREKVQFTSFEEAFGIAVRAAP